MQQNSNAYSSYWRLIWDQFMKKRLGMLGLIVASIFCIAGIYAPFLASSKPLVVQYDGQWYFPLFRYLFYTGFFTKRLDIFFNLLIFTFPLFVLKKPLFYPPSSASDCRSYECPFSEPSTTVR